MTPRTDPPDDQAETLAGGTLDTGADTAPTIVPASSTPRAEPARTGEDLLDDDRTLGGPSGPGTGPLTAGEAFGSRYHIIKELGVGGMGAVYQAWDAELGVAVALKLIRPGMGDATAARDLELRFKRELLLARQVTHKNVVRIHDLGELNGIKYITMPYVEGADLSHVLKESGTVPVPRALAIAKQVAHGLLAAHEKGIVHRDLKPANIMIDGETALIMDFGIARTVEPAGQPSPPKGTDQFASALVGPRGRGALDPALTTVGGVVGTIDYMAPEQARADPVDHRADIYAFGLIVYDMMLGPLRKSGFENGLHELRHRIDHAPPSPRSIDQAVPEALDAIVVRCIDPDPAARFQTTAELVAALDHLDDQGVPLPDPKRLTKWAVAAMVVLALGLPSMWWYGVTSSVPAAVHDPVSVLVADFTNNTNDAVFDGLIEQAIMVGVEEASFVTAYPRRDAQRLASQIAQVDRLDAGTASLVALREGVARVVTGSIDLASPRYRLSVNLVDPNGKKVLQTWNAEAANRDAVLETVNGLAAKVREGLGDETAASTRAPAEESFTAASLEAARAYASGQEQMWAGKYEEAYTAYTKAVELDPNLGRAYSGLGAVSQGLGRRQDAEGYYKQALARISRMSDREKYRTRIGYYLLTRDTDKARDELQALLKQFPADSAGLGNLALTEFYRRDMPRALELGLQGSALVPNNVQRKNNAALFAMYAGNFAIAEKQAAGVLQINKEFPKAYLAIALSQLATDRPADADRAWRALEGLPGSAGWLSAAGLADLAMYQGRLKDAAGLLEAAAASEQNPSRRARLLLTMAEVRVLQNRARDVAPLVTQALAGASDEGVLFLAARVLTGAGQAARAQELASKLGQRLDAESLMYAKVIEGEIALANNEPRTALERFKAAQQAADSWLARFGLGRAYLLGGAHAAADSEFDLCLKRRGEATAVLLDDVPTYHVLAPVHYYQGQAREGLGSPSAADSFKAFLAIKANGDEQGLVADARRRVSKP